MNSHAGRPHPTYNDLALAQYKREFASQTKFGGDLLALLDRDDVGIWRVERDGEKRDRWWIHFTLPKSQAEMFDLHLELVVLYTEYPHLEPRALSDIQERLRDHRVEPGFALLVSEDPEAANLVARRRGEIGLVPLLASELASDKRDLRSRIAEFVSTVDHFDVTNPIQTSTGFFGRLNELANIGHSLDRGQPVGIFGLRKAGKTSLMNALAAGRREAGRMVVRIDLSEVDGSADFKMKLLSRTFSEVSQHAGSSDAPRLRLLNRSGEPRFDLSQLGLHWTEDLRRILAWSSTRVELYIDEVDQAFPLRSRFGEQGAREMLAALTQLRGIIQSAGGPDEPGLNLFCAGVNPALFEQPIFDGRDNLLYKLVRLVWLAPMTREEVAEMVRSLGRRMGVRVRDHLAIDLLMSEYGGHPLLSRRACSRATTKRSALEIPFDLSVERLERAIAARGRGSTREEALDLMTAFSEWFPEEAALLALARPDDSTGHALLQAELAEDPRTLEHAIAYGLCNADLSARVRAAWA
jgi:hypothetical protein